jgi:hypothetical protein
MQNFRTDYVDDYSACERTYATLRIYSGQNDPKEVTQRLGLEATKISVCNDASPRTVNGWFLCSDGYVNSKDSRRHIDWLLDQVEPFVISMLDLKNGGMRMDIICFWESSTGNGGPIISPQQMKRLVALELDVGWDVWIDV